VRYISLTHPTGSSELLAAALRYRTCGIPLLLDNSVNIRLFLIRILKYGHFPFIDKSFSSFPFLNLIISN
jgi:hypothetical protein